VTSLQFVGVGAASFIPVCLAVHAARSARRRSHDQSVLEAIRAMTQALDAEPSQQALLREILALLTEQEQIATALEARIRGLLPELADPGLDPGALHHLDTVSELVTRLQRTSWILPDIEARIMRLLGLPEPPEAALSYVADAFDFSRDTLVRAQFIHVRDHAEQVPDSLVLSVALGAYSTEVASDAVQIFMTETDEYPGRSVELRAIGSIRRAAVGIFQEGLHHLPPSSKGGTDSDQSSGGPVAAGPGSVAEAQAGCPAERLTMRDVFDIEPGSPWWPSACAYLPVFTFAADDIRALARLDRVWARAWAGVQGLRSDIAGVAPGAQDAARDILWPGAHGSSAEVISELIGPKIASIVRARWLTWCAWDSHLALTVVISAADAAAGRLTWAIGAGLDRERAAYHARIGRLPRMDTVGGSGMARVATDLHEAGRLNARLAWALLAEGEMIRRPGRGGGGAAEVARLRAALSAADEALATGQAALAAGSYLEAARHVLSARLPLQSGSFPGHIFHQDLLAQARPLAVLAIAHRMAVARWSGLALAAYFHTRETVAEMVFRHAAEYTRAHEDIVLAANTAIAGIDRAVVR
jgi:hypothetical protein